jgi:flagellar hook-associated protein 3 FlgL
VQQQLGTGRRILTPSDDPVAATRALGVAQAQSVNGQYATTRKQANASLGLEENTLQSVTTTIQNIQTLLVNAGNGTMSDTDRASLATALQGSTISLWAWPTPTTATATTCSRACSQHGTVCEECRRRCVPGRQQPSAAAGGRRAPDGIGNTGAEVFMSVTTNAGYVLKGNAGNAGTATYGPISVSDPTNPLYGTPLKLTFQPNATTGAMEYQVSNATTGAAIGTAQPYTDGTPINVGGVSFTVKGTPAAGDSLTAVPAQQAGADIFANLQNVISALKKPIDTGANTDAANANLQNVLATGIRQMGNSLDNVLTVRSSVGSRMQELDALDTIGQNRDLNSKSALSDLQDLNYASAITEYYQRQTALQGAQQSFMQIQGMNLFQYLR